ncbi:hypothetical protein V7S57_02380 [Caulobacter sp. CCNWLY153]|uniref:hypothetical protein n=1 Tax=unclassified Caulobacter TaxID=2648921 RepID=UPI002FEF1C1B
MIRPGFGECMVLDCRRTGRPATEGRSFVCDQHMKAAGKPQRAALAAAAARVRRLRPSAMLHDRQRAEMAEHSAWWDLVRDLRQRCGVKDAESSRSEA